MKKLPIAVALLFVYATVARAQSGAPNLGATAGANLPPGALAILGGECFRHEGNIRALAFTPDGKTLAGYTVSSGIIVWDAKSGQVRRSLPVNLTTACFALALSPDGALVAAVEGPPWGTQYKARLWQTATGDEAGTLLLGKDGAEALVSPPSFSPDGKCLAICAGGSALVFDVASSSLRCALRRHDFPCLRCTFSPDRKTLVCADVASSPDAAEPGSARLALARWDIATAKLMQTLDELPPLDAKNRPGPLVFAPDGKLLALASDEQILLLHPATGKLWAKLSRTQDQVTDLAFTADGSRLISNCQTGIISVWNPTTRSLVRTIEKVGPTERQVAVASRASIIAVSTSPFSGKSTQTVRLWNILTGEEDAGRSQGHEAAIDYLDWSADGKTLVSAATDKVLFWNKDFKRRLNFLPGQFKPLTLSNDDRLVVADRARHQTAPVAGLHIVDTTSAEILDVLSLPNRPVLEAARFSIDGKKLFTLESRQIIDLTLEVRISHESTLRRWDVANAKQEQSWIVPTTAPQVAIASGEGQSVLGIHGQNFGVHDVESGRSRLLAGLARRDVHTVTLSPDGRLAAAIFRTAYSGTNVTSSDVLLVEMLTGKAVAVLKGDRASVGAVAWTPDSRMIAVGDIRPTYTVDDNVHIHLWDALMGTKIGRVGSLNADVTALALAPAAATVTAGLRDGTIYVFGVPNVKGSVRARALAKDEAEVCWQRLLGDDAGAAHRAIGALIDSPDVAVTILAARLKPAKAPDKRRIQELIANLDSPTFAVRQAATKELQGFGDQGLVQIRAALKENITLEARRRLQQILSALRDVPSPEKVRTMRAIVALERIGSKEARVVLETLANGEPAARETQDARLALQRLAATPRAPH